MHSFLFAYIIFVDITIQMQFFFIEREIDSHLMFYELFFDVGVTQQLFDAVFCLVVFGAIVALCNDFNALFGDGVLKGESFHLCLLNLIFGEIESSL